MKAACSRLLSRLRESDPHVFCPVYCGSLIRLFNNVIVLLRLLKSLAFIGVCLMCESASHASHAIHASHRFNVKINQIMEIII